MKEKIKGMTLKEFVQNYATMVVGNGKIYFYIPNWFEIHDNETVETHSFENLPSELKEQISSMRENEFMSNFLKTELLSNLFAQKEDQQ